ncbi:MAG: response regulator, partial [Gemmatimonadota bacterium]
MTRRRLAVIEDNPDNRLLLRAILGDAYDLDEYVDGPAALSGMATSVPDLALMDISLPGMGGPRGPGRRLEGFGGGLGLGLGEPAQQGQRRSTPRQRAPT